MPSNRHFSPALHHHNLIIPRTFSSPSSLLKFMIARSFHPSDLLIVYCNAIAMLNNEEGGTYTIRIIRVTIRVCSRPEPD